MNEFYWQVLKLFVAIARRGGLAPAAGTGTTGASSATLGRRMTTLLELTHVALPAGATVELPASSQVFAMQALWVTRRPVGESRACTVTQSCPLGEMRPVHRCHMSP